MIGAAASCSPARSEVVGEVHGRARVSRAGGEGTAMRLAFGARAEVGDVTLLGPRNRQAEQHGSTFAVEDDVVRLDVSMDEFGVARAAMPSLRLALGRVRAAPAIDLSVV